MTINEIEKQALQHIGQTHDGKVLKSFLERLVTHYADVRNMPEKTEINVRARETACNIIESEIISRLNRISADKLEITEEYE